MGRPPLLLMTRGVPGSGKSFWAEATAERFAPGRVKTICLDDLRMAVDRNDGKRWMGDEHEAIVQAAMETIVTRSLGIGSDVIVHNTHTSQRIPNRLRMLTFGRADPFMVDFGDVPMQLCVERDAARSRTVGVEVIGQMTESLMRNGASGWRDWAFLAPEVAETMLAAQDVHRSLGVIEGPNDGTGGPDKRGEGAPRP